MSVSQSLNVRCAKNKLERLLQLQFRSLVLAASINIRSSTPRVSRNLQPRGSHLNHAVIKSLHKKKHRKQHPNPFKCWIQPNARKSTWHRNTSTSRRAQRTVTERASPHARTTACANFHSSLCPALRTDSYEEILLQLSLCSEILGLGFRVKHQRSFWSLLSSLL